MGYWEWKEVGSVTFCFEFILLMLYLLAMGFLIPGPVYGMDSTTCVA